MVSWDDEFEALERDAAKPIPWLTVVRNRLLRWFGKLLKLLLPTLCICALLLTACGPVNNHHIAPWWLKFAESTDIQGWEYWLVDGTCNGYKCRDLFGYGPAPDGGNYLVIWRRITNGVAQETPKFQTFFRTSLDYVLTALSKKAQDQGLSWTAMSRILAGVSKKDVLTFFSQGPKLVGVFPSGLLAVCWLDGDGNVHCPEAQ